MINTIKKFLLPISLLIILGFVLFVINQVSGIYLLIQSNSQLLANIFLTVISLITISLTVWPVVIFMKLPMALKAPQTEDELYAYRKRLLIRLRKNQSLSNAGIAIKKLEDLPNALSHLDKEAQKVVHQTASAVFLTTSVSQNGKLDALTILATQSRMVWKIAHIYYQRPSLRELTYLYANVAGASFLASEIEDLDVTQQIEPVVNSFLKNSAGKSIPVIGPTANIILDSLLEGSTNAFLTLRVGNITKRYCGINEVISKKEIRKQSFLQATQQLKGIVMESSAKIISGLLKATRQAGLETLKSSWKGIRETGSRVAENIVEAGKKVNPLGKKKLPEQED